MAPVYVVFPYHLDAGLNISMDIHIAKCHRHATDGREGNEMSTEVNVVLIKIIKDVQLAAFFLLLGSFFAK